VLVAQDRRNAGRSAKRAGACSLWATLAGVSAAARGSHP
jgi:hypothetical protein